MKNTNQPSFDQCILTQPATLSTSVRIHMCSVHWRGITQTCKRYNNRLNLCTSKLEGVRIILTSHQTLEVGLKKNGWSTKQDGSSVWKCTFTCVWVDSWLVFYCRYESIPTLLDLAGGKQKAGNSTAWTQWDVAFLQYVFLAAMATGHGSCTLN